MADNVSITTQAGTGAVVNSSVSSSGAVSSSVSSGTNTSSQVAASSTFQTSTTGASGPQGEAGQDGVFSAIASQVEAEAGTDNIKGMTPLRVKQAIDELAVGDVSSVNTQTGTVVLDQDDVGDGTTYKQYSATEKTKLSGVATGATANSSDATLLARTNHTGSQAISTVTSLQTALDGKSAIGHAHTAVDVTDFDAEVANNSAVTLNTAKRTYPSADETKLFGIDDNATANPDAVDGPLSSVDNVIPRYDGTTGKLIQGTGYTIDDANTLLTDGLINSTTIVAAPGVAANQIEEYNLDQGVTIETVLVQDGLVDGRDVSVDGTKLDTISSGAEVNAVDSVNSRTGAVTIVETDVLPTQTGNSGKYLTTNGTASSWGTLAGGGDMSASTYDPATISEQLVGLTATQTLTNKTLTSPVVNTPTGIVKGDVGLGNVDNTSDATKNSATATLTNKTISGSSNTITDIGPSARTGGTKVGTFTCPASTGNHSVTGVGFTPKLVRLFATFTSATAANAISSDGAMDSAGNQWAKYSAMRALSSSNVAASSGFSAARCVYLRTISAGGAASDSALATYVSMDADGFTINFSVTNAGYSVMWEAVA